MNLDDWLRISLEDAEGRGLPELRPLLQGLAVSTAALRAADWSERVPLAADAREVEPSREEPRS